MTDKETVEQLLRSKNIIGEMLPIIVDKQDKEILSGHHRKEAGWQRAPFEMDIQSLADKKGVSKTIMKELVKLHANVQRKPSREETQASILKIAKEFQTQGMNKETIAAEVSKWVPYTHQYVLELLPDEYKQKGKAVSPGRPIEESVKLVKQESSTSEPQITENLNEEEKVKEEKPVEKATAPKAKSKPEAGIEEHYIVFKDGKILHNGGQLLSEFFETLGPAKIYVEIGKQ